MIYFLCYILIGIGFLLLCSWLIVKSPQHFKKRDENSLYLVPIIWPVIFAFIIFEFFKPKK